MAYVRPSLATFQAMFAPAFDALTQPQYDAWITQAERLVGENYGDDQLFATELLTAHLLSINNIGTGQAGSIGATGAVSFRSGAFSATLSDAVVAQRAKGGYGATVWGQQFQDIQRRLFGGPRLVRGEAGPGCGCW